MQSYLDNWRFWAQLGVGVLIAAAGLWVGFTADRAETGTTLLVLGTVFAGATVLG